MRTAESTRRFSINVLLFHVPPSDTCHKVADHCGLAELRSYPLSTTLLTLLQTAIFPPLTRFSPFPRRGPALWIYGPVTLTTASSRAGHRTSECSQTIFDFRCLWHQKYYTDPPRYSAASPERELPSNQHLWLQPESNPLPSNNSHKTTTQLLS